MVATKEEQAELCRLPSWQLRDMIAALVLVRRDERMPAQLRADCSWLIGFMRQQFVLRGEADPEWEPYYVNGKWGVPHPNDD